MEHNFKWKNDGRTKVMIGCGTRPEIIRLAAVIKRCREYFDCCVVYYNQNWDRNLSTVFWEDFELKNTFGEYGPDILVPVVGENLGVTCGNIMGRSYELLSELQPEGYLVLGDTNSCLSAISAKRLHIPLFHMEAGNRCKDECLPEETNRRIVDVISDVNMCYSEFARKYLADTGLPKERTYQTGSPMAEVLHMNLEKIQKSDVLERLGLEKDKYILLSAHREENIDSEKNFLSLFTAINALAEKYDMPMAILDAMGCGLPIVSTDVGGIPKIVRQGINGYLYKPGDSKSMACAIIEYLTDDEKRLKAGQESVDIIRESYSLQQNIDKLERVYTEVERLRDDKL